MYKSSWLLIIALLYCAWGMAFGDSTDRIPNSASSINQEEIANEQVAQRQGNPTPQAQIDRDQKPLSALNSTMAIQSNSDIKTRSEQESLINIDPAYQATGENPNVIIPKGSSALVVPLNDNCVDVTPVPLYAGTPLEFTGDNTGATNDCPALGFPEVWEAFTTEECMDIVIDFCDTYPVFHVVCAFISSGCPCENLTRNIGVDWVSCPEHNATMVFAALPPGTYYVPIFSAMPSVGPYVMHVTGYACPPPAMNDDCADAIPIGDVTDLAFTTLYATFDGLGACISSPNIWFIYTASCTGNAVASLAGSFYDTKMAVYDGASCDPLGDELGCNDDFEWDRTSEVIFPVIEGHQYLIEIGGYNSTTAGNGFLTTSCAPAPPNDDCADVTPVELIAGIPLTFNGDNTGASPECPMDSQLPEVWEAITLDFCMDVTIDYCGTNPAYGNAYGIINTGCPCDNYIFCSSMPPDECPDGNWTLHFLALPAGTYYIPILNDPPHGALGPYTLNINGVACEPPPPNDNCEDVTPVPLVPGTPLTFNGDNTGSTNDCSLLPTRQAWEAFTTDECLNITVNYCGTTPAFAQVYIVLVEGCPCGNLIYSYHYGFYDCIDGNASMTFFNVPAGTYYYPVYTEMGAIGPYTINVNGTPCPPPPLNDDCANAIPVDIPSSNSGTTLAASFDDAPTCYTFVSAPGVWYSLTGTGNQITASTCADYTDFNTQINIYSGSCGQFICVAGNDNNCGIGGGIHPYNSTATFCSEVGEVYYILVQGFYNDMGNFQLDISEGDPCEPPPPVPTCDANSLIGQSPMGPGDNWNFYNSDAAATPSPYIVYDNFSGATGDICGVTFWGLDVYFSNGWLECLEDPMDFQIIFYEDDGGMPGQALSTYEVTLSPVLTGLYYSAFELNQYDATLEPCCTLTDGWISIQGVSVGGDVGNCWFMWAISPDGDNMAYQDFTFLTDDMAFCLGGSGNQYLPGDANMYNGVWPPNVIGSDVTYLVNFFRGLPATPSCLLGGFYCAADVNGDCRVIGSDVTRLVSYFRGIATIIYCPDYEPAWPTPQDCPEEAPSGWPNCE